MTPDEIRWMPKRTILVIPSASAPMLVKTRPYFENRRLSQLANIPYHLIHVRTSPFTSPPSQGSSAASEPKATIIVDADPVKPNEPDDDHKHFIWENE